MSTEIDESTKAAIAIKTARTALGLSQLEFAEMMGVAKTTLARVETLEAQVKLDFYMKAVKLINSLGIEVDAISEDNIIIKIKPKAQKAVVESLANEANRRSDKKKTT
ncbi:MAG TPA: helix-turn-helix transcriptional regulator [Thiotrichales bacterium]|nr:helix-turn-helix transcriptional regulator [Thiotrichales bacterium]